MTDYRINLHHYPLIDQATQAAMPNTFRALLKHEPVDAEGMISAYHAWQDAVLHCTEWLPPETPRMRIGMAWSFVTKLKEGQTREKKEEAEEALTPGKLAARQQQQKAGAAGTHSKFGARERPRARPEH